MFGKLVKYELKDLIRTFVPLWAAALLLALWNGFALSSDSGLLKVLPAFLTNGLPLVVLICLIVAMFVVAFVTIIRRFFHDLLGEGGYLAFTLPVTEAAHINTKLLVAFLMEFGCFLIAIASACIVLGFGADAKDFWGTLGEVFRDLGIVIHDYPTTLWLLVEFFFLAIAASLGSILHMYFAMAIGHLFNNHRGILSLIAYVVTSWVFSFVLKYLIKLSEHFTDWLPAIDFNSVFAWDIEGKLRSLAIALVIALVLNLIYDAILWVLTHFILKRHLNVL